MSYVYADSTAVLGPLALRAEPGYYDLCSEHAGSLRVPRGWEVIRLPLETGAGRSNDDLLALADAVREAAGLDPTQPTRPDSVVEVARRGHLTLLADVDHQQR